MLGRFRSSKSTGFTICFTDNRLISSVDKNEKDILETVEGIGFEMFMVEGQEQKITSVALAHIDTFILSFMAGKFTRLYQLTRQPTLARTYVIRKTKSSRLTEHEHNAHLVQILTEHIHFLQTTPDTSDSAEKVGYKLRAYERAVRALRALDHKLETIDEARQVSS